MKRGQAIHYWHSASEVASATFVCWKVMRMHTGGEDTNKLGVGAIVRSDWRYCKVCHPRIDWCCKRGQALLRPYWALYRGYRSAWRYFRPIKRPTVAEVRKLERRRKS